ncbi:7987_t:CDS:2 [Scutellospora calospora]|uniref:7987_t:CDS:1 n=1 Tax=Scutellospora calospora TaxID=85575 RepID=A0ACA9KIM4_9GLOM|nr:7987_t:CDS:2 [Scutellospora calospora]
MSTLEDYNSDSSDYSDFIPDENEKIEEPSINKSVMTRSKRKKIEQEANDNIKTKRLRVEYTDINDELITVRKQVSEDSEAFHTNQMKDSKIQMKDNDITQSKDIQDVSSSSKEKKFSINQPSSLSDSPLSSSVKKSQSPVELAISERGKFGKPKSTLGQLAASLNKKPKKLNTLEKSKVDWKEYVDKEGIVDELKYHNKNGYIIKCTGLSVGGIRKLRYIWEE